MSKQHQLYTLEQELKKVHKELRRTLPNKGDVPMLPGIDIAGGVMSHNGSIGGDHIIFIDFNARYDLDARIKFAPTAEVKEHLKKSKERAGILIADVSGHETNSAILAGQLHQTFLLGARYELDLYGQITPRLFEELNQRFCHTSARGDMKFITMLYGEISVDGTFRFISAGHEHPKIFSYEKNQFADIQEKEIRASTPLGVQPSLDDIDNKDLTSARGYKKAFVVNERKILARGDILELHTDGLTDHVDGSSTPEFPRGKPYFPHRLEDKLQRYKEDSAYDIFRKIKRDIREYGPLKDDISMVYVKKL